ncbi:uncharacterized protein LODBEIA_P27810 [Lodderomyces beijingensis]|uniref:Phosphatidic acid phosphatase type 2/haloperoxidase domain-containing protein n=1 Tax=Lodderomyces beijingensis TaxID=1775926 RepID=A0ABP0ZMH6_9ASCO
MSENFPDIIPQHIPFDHTYILYDPTDIISIISVQFSLLPIYIMVFYLSWFLVTREIEPVIIVAGHLCSEVVNKVMKLIFKNPRPDFHREFGAINGKGHVLNYGMPSAHAQFIGFFAAYYSCVLLFKIEHLKKWHRRTGSLVLMMVAFGVAGSRIYLQYHTWQQVVVGVVVGVIFGLCYFVVSSVVRDVGVVDWVLRWPVVRAFHVKDSYFHCYQSFQDEYRTYLRQKREQKDKRNKKAV